MAVVSPLFVQRRRFLRSRACRAALWLLAFCFALNGAIARPLPMAQASAPSCAHHAQRRAQAADASRHAHDCCEDGACLCANAHAFAEAVPAPLAVIVPTARETTSTLPAAFAGRLAPPPLRPPIA